MKKTVPLQRLLRRIMHITVSQLLLAALFCTVSFAHSLRGQEILAQKITLDVRSGEVKKILAQIEEQAKVKFVYSSQSIKFNKRTTITAQGKPLAKVLDELLDPLQVQYEVVDSRIVLRKKNSQPPSRLESMMYNPGREIRGIVRDERGEGLPGVSVLIKGTQQGTITNGEGHFSLALSGDNAVLVISFVGYKTQEIEVGNQTSIDISLASDEKLLEEIVVVGYGTQKRKDLTGAISSIKAEDYQGQAPRNVQDLLRSNAPGLNIGIATDAKAEASLTIRGKGTLTASDSPLIVLDNVIYQGALADINPADILTVDILKDASAAAVYGARSANGVIVISTKRGRKGKPIINFSTNTGFAQVANQPKILDADSFLKFRQDYNEGRNSDEYLARYPQMFRNPFELEGVDPLTWYNYDQSTPLTSVTDQQLITQWLSRLNLTTPEIENYFAGKITRWDKLVFQKALQQDYTVSVSNASENTSLYFSLGYTDRQGVIVGDRYKNFRVRLNYETKITDYLSVGVNSQFANRNEGYLKALWNQMTMISPYGSNNIDDPNSIYQRRPTGLDPINPFYDNLYTERIDQRQNVIATLYSKIKLPFNIEYTMNYTPYYNWYEYYNHYSSKGANWSAIGGSSSRSLSRRFNWQIDNIINWSQDFGKNHHAEITLLANAEKAELWSTTANASNYSPNDVLGFHRLQAGAVQTVSSDDTYLTGDALMGRLFYSFKNRYHFTGSIRRDGYSAFGKKNPRAVFPSMALGWVITEEDFIKNAEWLNYTKLRLSWGENGNREIGQYAALSQMSSNLVPYIDGSGNPYSTSQIFVTTMANHNLKWERTFSFNLGLDFQLFQDRIGGSIETYISRTNDLLVSRALPNITGYSSVMSNLGQIRNKGLELNLKYRAISNNILQWNLIGNFSLNRRKIQSLYGDMINVFDDAGNIIGQKEANDETNQWFIGQDPDRIWSYKRLGVWQKEEREQAAQYGLQPGDFKYLDVNDDGIMNNQDKVFQGYKTPRARVSLRSETEYKNFRLALMFYSNLGYYGEFQRAANNYSFPDRTSDYEFPRWTATNPINDYARIGSKNIGSNWVNRSFIRLESVVLNYKLPQELLSRLKFQGLSFSASIQNLGYWAPSWVFWDPESQTVTPRTFNFGVNLTL